MHFELTWSIENMSMCAGNILDSPVFYVALLDHTKWRMQLKPEEFMTGDISCTLYRINDERDVAPITVGVAFAIVASNGVRNKFQKFGSRTLDKSHSAILFSSLIGPREFSEEREVLLPKDVLTLRCYIWKEENSSIDTSCVFLSTLGGLPNPVFYEEESSTHLKKSSTCKVCQPNKIFARTHVEVFRRDVTLFIREWYSRGLGKKTTLHLPSALGEDSRLLLLFHTKLQRPDTRILDLKISRNVSDYNKDILVQCKLFVMLNPNSLSLQPSPVIKRYRFKNPHHVWDLVTETFPESDEFIVNESLTLHFEFSISHAGGEYPSLISESAAASNKASNILRKEILQLYQEEKYSDVVLRTAGGRSFNVHKGILSSRSSVFRKMFQNEETKVVEVLNLEPDTIDKMLIYIYSGELTEMDTTDLCKLYAAAKLYSIPKLEARCSSLLKSSLILSRNNVFKILILADELEDADFMLYITQFLAAYGEDIINSSEWERFRSRNAVLALQVESYARRMRDIVFYFHGEVGTCSAIV